MNPTPRARPLPAFAPFFLAATLFAALAVPLWALDYTGLWSAWPGGGAPWHGHEMIFGYALAVVGGFLLTRLSTAAVVAVFCAWLAGRLGFLMADWPWPVEAIAALAFPACLFAFAGVPFLRAVKSWHNAIFAPLLAGFFAAELLYQMGTRGLLDGGGQRGLILGVDLIALLLFAMGGRATAAATSGGMRNRGARLAGVAQPRLERLGVLALLAMTVLDLFPSLAPWSAVAAALAGGAAGLRLVGWRFWRVMGVFEVSVLHLGYAWLSVGLALKAAAPMIEKPGSFDALHGLTVGAIGTLTLAMMTRVALQRSHRTILIPRPVLLSIGLISAAAIFRILAVIPEARPAAIGAAAACWTVGYLVFARFLIPLLARRRREKAPPRPDEESRP